MFHLSRALVRAADLFATQTAVQDGAVSLTYGAWASRVGALASGLAGLGVRPADRVALLDRNSFRAMELHFACAAIGAILVPLNVRLAKREIEQIVSATGAAVLFAPASLAHLTPPSAQTISWSDAALPGSACAYEELLSRSAGLTVFDGAPAETAQIFYTSGTSGRPKGVCLTHANLAASAYDAIAALQLHEGDVWLHVAPMFHLVDAFAIWAITLVGGRHVVRHFSADTFADDVAAFKITKTSMPPTMISLGAEAAGKADQRFATLERVSFGGSPMTEAATDRARDVMQAAFVQAYGITEASGLVTQQSAADVPPYAIRRAAESTASAGAPVISMDVRVVDEGGSDVPSGDVGEILVRGPRIMAGYWNEPEATAAAFIDGWYRTGDQGYRDVRGHLTIVGRKKDMIITGGENVYPTEIENVIAMHPAVLEVAVFGIPSERWGEEVRAAVVLRAGGAADAAELTAFCRDRIGGYKLPKAFDFYAEPLPKTGPGKIAKNLLRAPYWEAARTASERA